MKVPIKNGRSATQQDDQLSNESAVGNAVEEEYANLTIRVSKRKRLYWLIEAKKQGTSLTAAISQALTERFGDPK